ncbi:hypothetical protein BO99DRAFT_37859, partial [Aspergillus violaceofuscus CBS 115571]
MVQAVHNGRCLLCYDSVQLPCGWSNGGHCTDRTGILPRLDGDWHGWPYRKDCFFSFKTTALFQGLGNLLWILLINKYGRRPIYVVAFTLYIITAFWCAVNKGYAN